MGSQPPPSRLDIARLKNGCHRGLLFCSGRLQSTMEEHELEALSDC